MNQQTILEKFTATVLGLLFFVCLGFQLYALNKGFDITDEGYNLQLIQSKFIGISNTYYHEVVQLLFGWLPQTLLANRILATVLLIGSSVFFLLTAFRYFNIPYTAIHIFFCLLSIPFALTLDSVTLSYNNTTATFLLVSAGFYFLHIDKNSSVKNAIVFAFCSGFFAAIVCVTKITSGLALSISISILIMLFSKERFKTLLFFIIGWFAYHIIHGLFFTPFYTQVSNIMQAGNVFAQMDEHYQKFTLVNDAYLFLKANFWILLQFVGLFLIARFIPIKSIKATVLLFASAYFFYLFYTSEFMLTGLVYILFSLLCLAYTVANSISKNIIRDMITHKTIIIHALFLFVLPLFVVIGTNNNYNHNYVFATLPLAVLGINLFPQQFWYKQILLLLMAGCVFYVCYTKILLQPYRILPLVNQTAYTNEFEKLNGIKLDESSIIDVEDVKSPLLKHQFSTKHGLICLGKMQGVQYILEASSPGGVMFSPTFRELYLLNLAADTNAYQKPYFILSDYIFTDSLQAQSHNWEHRFVEILNKKMNQTSSFLLIDSVPFTKSPLGKLYIYKF